eukprot:CAMPEP_0116825906 /NCGR_PEP_ID=MMETSP0418-20121206/2237_1 /TAXON_ID=1158023 /ORGANISM="Astrosyne radiata, Strain 13vi08-1A" /LENGTH=175 /DNA_ID=CAMNT_0004454489 /DNA_START=172 /DNA_END=699 /DNA_ORIENTATION=+
MSKLELQRAAFERSGVSYEESLEASKMTPSLYERIGDKGFLELSQTFYDRVFDDKEAWFVNIFSSSTKVEAVENQYRFFVQTFGGPDLYRQKKGKYTRLVGRHANYGIGEAGAIRWLQHMKAAIADHEALQDDEEASSKLLKYFRYTAYYIVETLVYMRPDQLSGGTQIDPGRIW